MQGGLLLQEDPQSQVEEPESEGSRTRTPLGVPKEANPQPGSATKGDLGRTEGWSHVEGSCPSKGVPAALGGLEGSQE